MDLVEKQKVSIVDAHFWVVINNVPSGFKYRRAALINKGYSKWQVDHSIKALCDLNLIRETKINLKNVQYEAVDLQKECPETRQTMSGNSTNYVRNPDTNKTISKNRNNGENLPKESPTLTPLRGGLNIDHILMPGTRRKRLEDSIEKILGFDLMPAFFKWLEADFMKDKTKLPIRAYTKKRQDILSLATNYLSLTAQGYNMDETPEDL